MQDILEELYDIEHEKYGEDVRQAIHDALLKLYENQQELENNNG
jgi:DNA-binding cell septation regulator SpoVG